MHEELQGTRVRRRQLQAAGGGGKAKPRRGSTGRQGTRPREEEMAGTRWCSTGAGRRSWPWRGRTAARGGNKCGERTSGSAGVRPWARPEHGQGASRGAGVRPSTRRARPGRGDRKWARAKRGEEGRSSQGCVGHAAVFSGKAGEDDGDERRSGGGRRGGVVLAAGRRQAATAGPSTCAGDGGSEVRGLRLRRPARSRRRPGGGACRRWA